MKSVLKLTEYRQDGNFYPIIVLLGEQAVVVREADLEAPGPVIIGQTKSLGKGSMLIGVVPGHQLVVKESLIDIAGQLG